MITTSHPPKVNGKRVIIVEDDRDFRESIVEYFELSGLDVTGVASALEFYKSISSQKFHLVILDIGLPDQNGLVLAEFIRNNTDMRIVMLTANSAVESRITAYKSGADIYLTKPVDFSELSASVYSILGRLDRQLSAGLEMKKVEPTLKKEQKHWRLICSNWTLHSPAGDEIKLTSKEFDLIQILASFNNSVVLRQDILKTLDYEQNDFGNRALVALVNRLRSKHEKLNFKCPVKTVHGSGYCFSAPIIIEA